MHGTSGVATRVQVLGLCKEVYGVDVENRNGAYSDDKLMSIGRESRDFTYPEADKYGLDIFQCYENINRM